ncbi:hypothetical protein HMPREF9997_02782 [Corynebacterium durum F0235]|uniref:Uncharacterized protein n=1 Tax=Corynebacterium durum F0235 TaxID=1035195 RepID=L1M947_9CORY|nr:hypothetical protein HMPREF9997_02782 [Corynebacterium durum F0235]
MVVVFVSEQVTTISAVSGSAGSGFHCRSLHRYWSMDACPNSQLM